jgi:hypothetical protein
VRRCSAAPHSDGDAGRNKPAQRERGYRYGQGPSLPGQCELTHKPGVINTTKEIRRDSEEEEEFPEDLVRLMKQSGATSKEPLFSRRAPAANGIIRLKVRRPRMVTEAIKAEVTRQGLDPTPFSFHSLRKGAVTHMKALGVSREETLARGNYSKASVMIDTTYNYNSSGTGPLGAMNSNRAKVPGREDIARKVAIPYQKYAASKARRVHGAPCSGIGGKWYPESR